MTIVERLLQKPRTFAARGWLFQIHLWTGLAVALYAIVIGLSGSAVVFAAEIRDWQVRDILRVSEPGVRLDADQIVAAIHTAHPGERLSFLFLPFEERGVYRAFIGAGAKSRTIYVHPFTGAVLGARTPQRDWLGWLEDLHFNLLGGTTGRIVNGVFSLILLILCATGIVLWWPGLALWVRAASINWKAQWKRVNYDLHNAIGLFSLLFVVVLSLTGAYLAWPNETRTLISFFSPVRNGAPTAKVSLHPDLPDLPLRTLIAKASAAAPESWPELLIIPSRPGQAARVYMMGGTVREYQTTTLIDVDPKTGAVVLAQKAQGRSAGDALYAWLKVIHFGYFGGIPILILWFVLGLTPAFLAVTGVLMWWNRSAGKKFAKWRRADRPTPQPLTLQP
jgi:uncharacterized iron-regulated membrane protein